MLQELDYGKLGLRIKEARQSKNLTQEMLAELVLTLYSWNNTRTLLKR